MNFIMGLWLVLLVSQQLSRAGLNFEGAACALLLLMAGGTLAGGWLFRLPVVVAPSAAIAGFLCYDTVLSQGFTTAEMLGAVTVAGVICMLLYVFGAYTRLEKSLPEALKRAVGVALGLWLVTLGLKQSGLLIGVPQGVMGPGNMLSPVTFYSLVGIAAGAAILANGHRSGIIIGMLVTVAAAFIDGYVALPNELFMPPEGLDKVVLQADVLSCWKLAGVVVAIVMTNLCAAVALSNSIDRTDTPDKVNTPYSANTAKLFCFNGLLTAIGGLLGCGQAMVSPLSAAGMAAAEASGTISASDTISCNGNCLPTGEHQCRAADSAVVFDKQVASKKSASSEQVKDDISPDNGCEAMIKANSRLCAVNGPAAYFDILPSAVTAVLFLLLVPCMLLIKELALEPCVTGPAAVLAGVWYTLQALHNMQDCISKGNKDIEDNFKNIFREKPLAISVLLMIVLVPLWGNIAYGIGAGLVSYTLLSTAAGRYREIPPILWAVSAIFLYSFSIAI